MPITSANTNPFVGTWNSSWTSGAAGSGKLTINADGTGSYDWKGGRLEGKFNNNNQTYDGTYTQSDGSGTFTFNLRGSDSFEGPYASSGGGGGTWQGTRPARRDEAKSAAPRSALVVLILRAAHAGVAVRQKSTRRSPNPTQSDAIGSV